MGFGQSGNVQGGFGSVRVHACIEVCVIGAGQFSVHFYAVGPGNRRVHQGPHHSFHSAGIGFGHQIHLDLVAAAQGDVAAAFVLAFLFQYRILIDGNRIGRSDKGIRIGIDIFRHAACFAFHLIGHVYIGMGVENLTPACGHFGFRGIGRTVRAAFADIDAGGAFDFLFGFNVRRDLDHAAHIHMIVVVFPLIGIGVYLVGGHHIALAGLKLGPFFQLRFGIHLHRVIGVGPCHA